MLVLSRRVTQQVVFPHLGIELSILQVRGQIVKIGIAAPQNVKILRREVLDNVGCHSFHQDPDPTPTTDSLHDDEVEHQRRNDLNLLQLRLESIQRRIDRGERLDAESTLNTLLANASSLDHQLASVQNQPVPTTAGRSTRVLVVEDCDNERGLMAGLLASHGFIVHVARDGGEALEQLQHWGSAPDVVLMDLQMPMFNGLEALHRIRDDERLANLKVFAVTGSKRVIENEPVGRSWDRWFSKPLDVRHLIQCLRDDDLAARKAPVTGLKEGLLL